MYNQLNLFILLLFTTIISSKEYYLSPISSFNDSNNGYVNIIQALIDKLELNSKYVAVPTSNIDFADNMSVGKLISIEAFKTRMLEMAVLAVRNNKSGIECCFEIHTSYPYNVWYNYSLKHLELPLPLKHVMIVGPIRKGTQPYGLARSEHEDGEFMIHSHPLVPISSADSNKKYLSLLNNLCPTLKNTREGRKPGIVMIGSKILGCYFSYFTPGKVADRFIRNGKGGPEWIDELYEAGEIRFYKFNTTDGIVEKINLENLRMTFKSLDKKKLIDELGLKSVKSQSKIETSS